MSSSKKRSAMKRVGIVAAIAMISSLAASPGHVMPLEPASLEKLRILKQEEEAAFAGKLVHGDKAEKLLAATHQHYNKHYNYGPHNQYNKYCLYGKVGGERSFH